MRKKLWITFVIIVLLLFTVVFFVLPRLDFMYVPAYKHWMKDKIRDKEKVTDVKYCGHVAQAKDGVYFAYKDKLMFIDAANDSVKEVCAMDSGISGVMVKGEDVFVNGGMDDIIYKMDKSGDIKPCIDKQGYIFLDGDYIYVLGSSELGKYSLDGKKIWVNHAKYDHFSYNQVFDEHVLYQDDYIGITVPHYYLLDINKVRYKDWQLVTEYPKDRILIERAYEGMDTTYLSEWAKDIDKKVREGGIYDSSETKSLDNYELRNIVFKVYKFSRASNGYIYFIGQQTVNYRDRDFDKKFKSNVSRQIEDEEKKKLEYTAYLYPIFRAKVEYIENSKDYFYFRYEPVSKCMKDKKGINEDFSVDDEMVSLLTIDYKGADKHGDMYIYNIDIKTGDYKEVFRKKTYFLEDKFSEVHLTDNHIFIYEHNSKKKEMCITRIDRDGSNPILVMNEKGEVVMKPLEIEP